MISEQVRSVGGITMTREKRYSLKSNLSIVLLPTANSTWTLQDWTPALVINRLRRGTGYRCSCSDPGSSGSSYRHFFVMTPQSILARASSLSSLHDHTQKHPTRYDSSGRVISPTQRSQPDNTQHSKETDVHPPGGIRTRSPVHWYRPTYWQYNYMFCLSQSTSNSEVLILHQSQSVNIFKRNFKTVCVKCAALAEQLAHLPDKSKR